MRGPGSSSRLARTASGGVAASVASSSSRVGWEVSGGGQTNAGITTVGTGTRSAKSRQSTAASRGRTCRCHGTWAGNQSGCLTNRTLPTASHSGDTANRMFARSRTPSATLSTVGAGLAGLLGQYAGARTSLWVGAVGAALTWLPLYCSPVRRLADPAALSAADG